MTRRVLHGLRQSARRAWRRMAPGALILLYHRVAELHSDPLSLNVTPRHFAEHLDVLTRRMRPMRLADLAAGLRHGRVPRRAVVVTLDDGYADSLHHASPLLERHGMPATIFVTTGYVDGAREFWWDELEKAILQATSVPDVLRLSVGGQPFEWRSGSPREQLYRALWQRLLPLQDLERRSILDEVLQWAAVSSERRPTHEVLSSREVRRLAQGALIDIGAHTVTHPLLSALPTEVQRREIHGSKTWLEDHVGRPVTAFAYPYGWGSSYTRDTVQLVQSAGFECGCSAVTQEVRSGARTFELPRVMPGDWGGDEFLRRLDRL